MDLRLNWFIYISFGVFVIICADQEHQKCNLLSEKIGHGVRHLFKTGNVQPQLCSDIEALRQIQNCSEKNSEICNTCKLTVGEIIKSRKTGMSKDCIKKNLNKLCHLFTSWHNATCKGYIDIEMDTVLYMIDNKNITSARFCSIYFQEYGCQDPNYVPWDINIPCGNSNCQTKIELDDSDDPDKLDKILHLTDFHYDPMYKPGSKVRCDYELCCQKSDGAANSKSGPPGAGHWGSYGVCDTPWHTIENALEHIKKEHTCINYVYFTGDIISHRSWDTSVKSNTATIKKMYRKLADTFGKIPVYPVLGNHEPHPTDFFSSGDDCEGGDSSVLTTQWLFDLVAHEWTWLPEKTHNTIKKGGYYTVIVKPGLRLIALNSNVCYKSNLWLIYNDVDPYGQLQWLADTLKEAEEADEVVHILSHVPPGNVECLKDWNNIFHKIITRFANIVKAQFNGHTHYDEFRLFYDQNKTKAINVAYNGGSFTTFVGFNPNYRIYDVDSSSAEVVDYSQYYFNLNEANEKKDSKSPEWKKLYSFKQAYKVNSMNLKDLKGLVDHMGNSSCLVEQYYKFQVRNSEPLMQKGCDAHCLKAKLCAIKSTKFEDAVKCHDH